jgi:hypothetical protein
MPMQEFKTGDIVKVKGFQQIEYYIVTDVVDFSKEGDEMPDIECEIGRIYPVSHNFSLDLVNQNKLEMVAKYDSKESKMMLDFLKKEREKLGMFDKPVYMDIVEINLGLVEFEEVELKDGSKVSVVEPNGYPTVIRPKFGEREIKRLLSDTTTEEQMEIYAERMDTHLDLLHKALNDGDKEEVDFQKEQLEKVRQKLMELEYFGLKK